MSPEALPKRIQRVWRAFTPRLYSTLHRWYLEVKPVSNNRGDRVGRVVVLHRSTRNLVVLQLLNVSPRVNSGSSLSGSAGVEAPSNIPRYIYRAGKYLVRNIR